MLLEEIKLTVTPYIHALVGDLVHEESYGAAMGFQYTSMDVGENSGPIFNGIIPALFGYSRSFVALAIILPRFCIFFVISGNVSKSRCNAVTLYVPSAVLKYLRP